MVFAVTVVDVVLILMLVVWSSLIPPSPSPPFLLIQLAAPLSWTQYPNTCLLLHLSLFRDDDNDDDVGVDVMNVDIVGRVL